jgi:hypothetical protein
MNVIHIFSRFFMRVGNVLFSYYKTEDLIWLQRLLHMYVLGITTKGKCDTVNSEYTVSNNKYYHLSYTHLFGYINCYYGYKTHTKTSLKDNAD